MTIPEMQWKGRHLWLGGLWIGQVIKWSTNHGEKYLKTPYRGWLLSEEDGEETGWYASEEEAKSAVIEAARSALRQGERE